MSKESKPRQSSATQGTQTRRQIDTAPHSPERLLSLRSIDRLVIVLGSAGIAGYIYQHHRKVNPWELAGVAFSSLTLGLGFWGLGKRSGVIQGTDSMQENSCQCQRQRRKRDPDSDELKNEFQGQAFEALDVAGKIAWLRKELDQINEVQEDEQLRCGQAYIAKEEAYVEYEKKGNYGGESWKRSVISDVEARIGPNP
jgi:hypothetical protein